MTDTAETTETTETTDTAETTGTPGTPDPYARFRDAFNPEDGKFRENVRITDTDAVRDEELRESMRAFGWLRELPAIKDEHGVVIVGHRRMRIAAEIGISQPWPVITETFGDGDAGDAQRFRLALATNIGGAPLTKADRAELAKYLYGDRNWTMARIGDALGVSIATIQRDLTGFTPDGEIDRPKGGRPKNAVTRKIDDEQIEAIIAEDLSWRDIMTRFGVGQNAAQNARTRALTIAEYREQQAAAESLTPVLAPASAPPPPARPEGATPPIADFADGAPGISQMDPEGSYDGDGTVPSSTPGPAPDLGKLLGSGPAVNPPATLPDAPDRETGDEPEVINGWTWDTGTQRWLVQAGTGWVTCGLSYDTPPEIPAALFGILTSKELLSPQVT